MSDERKVHYIIEYARSGRSSCGISKKNIPANTIRLGRNSPSPFHDGYITKWYLPKVFFDSKRKMRGEISSAVEIAGIDLLRLEDQRMIREMIGEEIEEEAPEVVEGNKRLWMVKESLAKLSVGDMQDLLVENGLPEAGGAESLKNRIADAMVFGRATCATCPTQDQCYLKYSSQEGLYQCKTDLKWGKCGYEGNNVIIHDWVNVSVNNDPILNQWSGRMERPRKKIVRKEIPFYNRDPKAPLKGMKFSSIGRLSKYLVKDLQQLILENGGYYSSAITPDLDYVISTFTYSNNPENTKTKLAESYHLCIVTELLVERLLDEFGFDQTPYILSGNLPPIAFAQLDTSLISSEVDMTLQLSPPGVIDTDCKIQNGIIYKEGEKMYDVLLSITDANSGVNRYYRLQLISVSGKFIVFKRWGKVGHAIGGNTCSALISFEEAIENFSETFLDKTGNSWNSDVFEKQQNKYFIVLMEDAEQEDSYEAIFSILEPRLKEFISLIFDTVTMKEIMKSLDIDTRKLPLTKLSKEHIMNAFSILGEIEKALEIGGEEKTFSVNSLTNEFFALIPTDFGNKRPELIDSLDRIKSKLLQLETLRNIQIASSLIEGTVYQNANEHPADQNYKKLKTKLKPLSLYTKHFRIIKKYLENGYEPTKLGYNIEVVDALEVLSVDFEVTKLKNTNKKLVWYGTNIANVAGILAQGISFPPEFAPSIGYPMGKSIQFSDRVENAALLCNPTPENPMAVLLLCVINTENTEDMNQTQTEQILVNGRYTPNPKEDMSLDNVVVPLGVPIPTDTNAEQDNADYHIYTDQYQLKYCVTVRFTPV